MHKNLVKFGFKVFKMYERTNRQTDILITLLRTLPEGKVTNRNSRSTPVTLDKQQFWTDF